MAFERYWTEEKLPVWGIEYEESTSNKTWKMMKTYPHLILAHGIIWDKD